ncbi:hypothetical protein ACIQNU_03470 [Streptomyces sp. NPDC091292]|uniref:hypothetical protein n=1 Tax=Streptomyces sp. NPDC091292 TaxID=3365991 RepID=UPI003821FDF6
MKITTGSVITMTPVAPGWVVIFDQGGEVGEVTCPVIGWATVVNAHLNDGTVHTEIKPAFLWGDMVWTEHDLREHAPEITRVEIRPGAVLSAVTD